MSGGMHWKGANPDNYCYHKHCREKTFSDFAFCFFFIIFHNVAATGSCPSCQEEKQKSYSCTFGDSSSNCREHCSQIQRLASACVSRVGEAVWGFADFSDQSLRPKKL